MSDTSAQWLHVCLVTEGRPRSDLHIAAGELKLPTPSIDKYAALYSDDALPKGGVLCTCAHSDGKQRRSNTQRARHAGLVSPRAAANEGRRTALCNDLAVPDTADVP